MDNWVANANLTSHFKLTEDVAAAYASLSFKGNAKTDFEFGLRYEYTSTNLGSVEQPDVVDRQYGSLFPSVYVSRKISDVQQLNLSYSRRIAQPGLRDWHIPHFLRSIHGSIRQPGPATRLCERHSRRLSLQSGEPYGGIQPRVAVHPRCAAGGCCQQFAGNPAGEQWRPTRLMPCSISRGSLPNGGKCKAAHLLPTNNSPTNTKAKTCLFNRGLWASTQHRIFICPANFPSKFRAIS